MKTIIRSLLAFCFLIATYSCEKEPTIIDGNQIPPHDAISQLAVENFINKSYIDLKGRKPTTLEFEGAKSILASANHNKEAKMNLVKALNDNEYFHWQYEIFKSKYLEGLSDQSVQNSLNRYISLRQMYQPGSPFYQAITRQIDRLIALDSSWVKLAAGDILINEFVRPQMDNEFYDDINMGSTNFVLACFENTYNRLPTQSELANAVDMVNGAPRSLLLQTGDDREDFVNILTSTNEYFESIIQDLYSNLLAREPSSQELNEGLKAILIDKDYSSAQARIMAGKEYAEF